MSVEGGTCAARQTGWQVPGFKGCSPAGAPRAWGFSGPSGNIEVQPKGNFRTNDAEEIRAAVLADIGVAHAPGWLFAREIAANTVLSVLRDYEPAPLSISAVRPAGRQVPTKVRVFIDFLEEIFAAEPTLKLTGPPQAPRLVLAGLYAAHASVQIDGIGVMSNTVLGVAAV